MEERVKQQLEGKARAFGDPFSEDVVQGMTKKQ